MKLRSGLVGPVLAAVSAALCVVPGTSTAQAAPWSCSRVEVMAHRGFGPDENTLPAFNRAVRQHADVLETDLRRTSDGVVVLRHDDDLGPSTNGTGLVSGSTWDYVQGLETAHGYQVPTVRRLVARMAARRLRSQPDLQLELKVPFRGTQVRELVALLREFSYKDRVVLTSERLTQLDVVHRVAPRVQTGLVDHTAGGQPRVRLLRRHHVDWADVGTPAATATYVRSANRRGISVSARDMARETAARRHVARVLTDLPLGC